jgi:hypothetical protein
MNFTGARCRQQHLVDPLKMGVGLRRRVSGPGPAEVDLRYLPSVEPDERGPEGSTAIDFSSE